MLNLKAHKGLLWEEFPCKDKLLNEGRKVYLKILFAYGVQQLQVCTARGGLVQSVIRLESLSRVS